MGPIRPTKLPGPKWSTKWPGPLWSTGLAGQYGEQERRTNMVYINERTNIGLTELTGLIVYLLSTQSWQKQQGPQDWQNQYGLPDRQDKYGLQRAGRTNMKCRTSLVYSFGRTNVVSQNH